MTIYGWDASHYDQVPDGARVVAEGITFMTHKAGGDANDAELAAWWKELKPQRGKLLLGAYWVLRRPVNAGTAADAFLARLDSQCPGWRDGPFILQLDCEPWNDGVTPAPTKSQILDCADRLAAKMPKLKPIVYAPKWAYQDTLRGLGYPLWASAYVGGVGAASVLYPGDSSSRWDAYSGQTPAILQFSSSATIAGQTTCDANAYRGTLAQLTALLAPGWKQEEPDMELTDKEGSKAYPGRDVQDFILDVHGLRDVLRGDPIGAKAAAYPVGSPLMQLLGTPAAVAALTAQVNDLAEKVNASVVISQDQLDQAMLNALKTLAGGQ